MFCPEAALGTAGVEIRAALGTAISEAPVLQGLCLGDYRCLVAWPLELVFDHLESETFFLEIFEVFGGFGDRDL